MELTVRLSFKRNGEIFGARITYQTPNVSDEERCALLRRAAGGAQRAVRRCRCPQASARRLRAGRSHSIFTTHDNNERLERHG